MGFWSKALQRARGFEEELRAELQRLDEAARVVTPQDSKRCRCAGCEGPPASRTEHRPGGPGSPSGETAARGVLEGQRRAPGAGASLAASPSWKHVSLSLSLSLLPLSLSLRLAPGFFSERTPCWRSRARSWRRLWSVSPEWRHSESTLRGALLGLRGC